MLMDFASNTKNTRRLSAVGLATLFALLSGCFTDPVGGETGATGGNCDEGSFGCDCLAGACEPELVCTPSNICISENCTPGTAICDCDAQGRCGPGLECTGNVCLPQGGTTITPTSTEGDTSTGTATTGTSTTSTTMPTDTMPSSTSLDTETSATDADTTAATQSSTTGSPLDCVDQATMPGQGECATCFQCTDDLECLTQLDTCEGTPGCQALLPCFTGCVIQGLCNECCTGFTKAAAQAAMSATVCRQDACAGGACESFVTVQCNPTG